MSSRPTPRRLLPNNFVSHAHPAASTKPTPKQPKVSLACSECRKHKSKCSGGVPCNFCRNSGTDCVKDQATDSRRTRPLRKRLESLSHQRSLLLALVDNIENSDSDKLDEFLTLLRREKPDRARQYLSDKPAEPSSQSSSDCRPILDLSLPSDSILHTVPAQPWTDVACDSDYVSHLISIFFTWVYPICSWIDRELFIRDMQAGASSLFCSPSLVNAILAIACIYAHPPKADNDGSSHSLSFQFYHKARIWLDQELGQLTLPGIQARCAIYFCTYGLGKQVLAWQYLAEITDQARELVTKRHAFIVRAGVAADDMARAVDKTIFGLFSLTSLSSIIIHQPILTPKPVSAPGPNDHDPGDRWTSYPCKGDSVPAHTNCVANTLFDLHVIERDYASMKMDATLPGPAITAEIESFYDRLQHWLLQIPNCLHLRDSSPVPGILDLHIRYQVAVLLIFGRATLTIPTPATAATLSEQDKQRCVNSANEISHLMNRYHSLWPIDSLPVTYIHYITVALQTLLDLVPEVRRTEPFLDLEMALRALGRRWPMAMANLKSVQTQIETRAGDG